MSGKGMKLPVASGADNGMVSTVDQYLGGSSGGKHVFKLGVQSPEGDYSTWPSCAIYIRSNSGSGIIYRRVQATGNAMTFAVNDGANAVGSISCNASATTYATSSDERLKEDIRPLEGALDKIQEIKARSFKWKVDGKEDHGFIAQELHQVVHTAVLVGDEAPDENGILQSPWSVDPSKLVVLLVGAIQEMKKEIDTLKDMLSGGGRLATFLRYCALYTGGRLYEWKRYKVTTSGKRSVGGGEHDNATVSRGQGVFGKHISISDNQNGRLRGNNKCSPNRNSCHSRDLRNLASLPWVDWRDVGEYRTDSVYNQKKRWRWSDSGKTRNNSCYSSRTRFQWRFEGHDNKRHKHNSSLLISKSSLTHAPSLYGRAA